MDGWMLAPCIRLSFVAGNIPAWLKIEQPPRAPHLQSLNRSRSIRHTHTLSFSLDRSFDEISQTTVSCPLPASPFRWFPGRLVW
uniref:Putative secreted protein n=1 Tax=Anopheles darlingi TaxID=43151 RepID=A0A2M4DG10_ANODA